MIYASLIGINSYLFVIEKFRLATMEVFFNFEH